VVELTTREICDPYFFSPVGVQCWPLTPT